MIYLNHGATFILDDLVGSDMPSALGLVAYDESTWLFWKLCECAQNLAAAFHTPIAP